MLVAEVDGQAAFALDGGEELGILGPLGNGFELRVERPLLVGGGIGVAPLPFLSERLGRPPARCTNRSAKVWRMSSPNRSRNDVG